MKTAKAILVLIAALFLFYPVSSMADTITLSTPNAAISGYPAPYAIVTVSLVDSTHATIIFTAQDNYTMGDGSAAALNVNATNFTASGITETNIFLDGFNPTFKQFNFGSQEVNSFGKFNFTIDNKDAWGQSATTISFTLTDISGTWANAADVLTPNAGGSTAAAHIFVPNTNPPTKAGGAVATGYAANGVEVPEPGILILLGIAMSAVGIAYPFVRKI